MYTANHMFESELRSKINEELAMIGEILFSGNITDIAQYRYYVGAAHALNQVLDMSNEIKTTVEKSL